MRHEGKMGVTDGMVTGVVVEVRAGGWKVGIIAKRKTKYE